jgi:hypothetical protein
VACVATLFIFRHLQINLPIALALSIVCGGLSAAATAAWLQRKRKVIFLKRSDEAQKEKLLFHLACLSDTEKTEFFLPRLRTDETQAQRFGKLRIHTDEKLYWLRFNFTPVNPDDILTMHRWKTHKEKILLCNKIEDTAYALAQRFQIRVLTGNEVYAYLKNMDALPQSYLEAESSAGKRQRRLHLWLARKNAKPFLIAATLTLITAAISPFQGYYLTFGFLLLIAAVFIRIYGYK